MYNKRIICDIDDTICRTLDRNWENAEPILPVINKINTLYDKGWEIYLLTARGQLSCNGDFEQADKKYRVQIEKWLKEHGVKYHKISFRKELATYYVDDKSLTPEDFLNLEIKELKGGWSGASVEVRNGRVYKTHPNSLYSSKWFDIAKNFCYVPEIYSVIGDTLCMEYIKSDGYPDITKLCDLIDKFKTIPHQSSPQSYVDKLYSHYQHNQFSEIEQAISIIEDCFKCYPEYLTGTFCHGDLTLDNVILKSGNNYLIDPIYEEDGFNSWVLDVSKLLCSLMKKKNIVGYNYVVDRYKDYSDILFPFELSQWVRIYKYAPIEEKELILTNIKDLIKICLKN